MLDFLKGYNKFHIYDRAKNAELTLRAFDAITPMATFVEAVMKAAYSDCYSVTDKRLLKGMSLDKMFDDVTLTSYIMRAYGITNNVLFCLDNNIRRKSNFYKHDTDPYELTEEFRKECFKSIYLLASGYYKNQSGKAAPVWDESQFKQLYDSAIDESAREKLDHSVGPEIEELNKQVSVLKKEKTEANRQIELLTAELSKAQLSKANAADITKLNARIEELEKQINDADGQSILLKEKARAALQEKNTAEKELKRLQSIYSTVAEEQSQEAKNRIAEIQRDLDRAQKKAEELDKQNTDLNTTVRNLMIEKQRADRKIAELGKLTADTAAIAKIERSLIEAQASKAEIVEELEAKEKKLEEIEKLFKIKASELDKLDEEYQRRQRKIAEAQQYLEKNAPRCPHCNAPLKFNRSKFGSGFYWNCPNYRKDGSGCIGGITNSNYQLDQIIRKYNEIIGDVAESETFIIPGKKLEKYKTPEIKYSPYPNSFTETNPPTFLFQSISVPKEVFRRRHENRIDLFSKFYVTTNLERETVQEKNRTLYSLALRLLNRGIVLPECKSTESALRTKFNKNDLGAINWLYDSTTYCSPFFPYDSTREKTFAEYYFPRVIGENWATFVYAQAGIDTLIPTIGDQFAGQRVDFYINKNGRKLVVELDGPEHVQSRYADENRDRFLQANGYIVRRFKNADVDAKSEDILHELTNILGTPQNTRIDADVDNKYLVASKLCHQFAVAIVKCLERGYIGSKTNLKAEYSSTLFSQSEVDYILRVAAAEVYSIISNFSILYACTDEWNFFDHYAPEVWISVGDGRIERCRSILIRDCTLPNNILCEIEDYPDGISLEKSDEEALEFFLDYIFGFPGFKAGQYTAIKRLLEKKDTIVLLPTGSGKSIVYQLSSFIVPGLVVVVAPLISLIEDQVQNLERKNGITSSIYFASTVTQDDKERKEKSRRLMQHNATTLIYLAPERLMIPAFREDVRALLNHNSVYAVAIDEAHCVSEWGHDFRPAYLNVGNAARNLFSKNGEKPVISALTGTASDAVLNDVRLDLGIRGNEALVQPDTFDRPELHFSVHTCEAKSKDFNIANLVRKEIPAAFDEEPDSFSKLQGEDTYSGIVFTPLAKKSRSQYSALEMKGILERMLPEFGVAEYFSSTPKDYDDATWKTTIRENARKFKDDEINLLVATKAFGMGIDKPNIRFIIHDGLPTSFEQYYQEAGRAGRDGKPSECILLFSNDNEEENEHLLNPELSLSDFKKAYSKYDAEIYQNDSQDDVSALLYFHNGTFKGIENETKVAGTILECIGREGFEENKTIRILMPLKEIEETDDGDRLVVFNKNDREKDWIQALVRLLILGIITDYTYDYRQNFIVSCGKLDKESVAERYGSYVSGNVVDKNRILREKALIRSIDKTGIEFAKDAVAVLVNYIYENIEQSRRRAIHEMFDAVKQAAEKQGEEQNQFLRERITQYFKYKGENRDALKAVENGEHGGLLEVVDLFDLSTTAKRYTDDEKQRAREVYVLAGRVLESKPDHPGLLLAQAIGRMISGDYNEKAITNNIMAAIRFARERYLVDADTMKSSFYPSFNAVLCKSPDMFDELIEFYSAQIGEDAQAVISDMVLSEQFGDESRDYLLASFASLLVNDSIGRFAS